MTTNPDVRQYVDLTLYDRSTQQIFEAALSAIEVRFPEWTPREGTMEVVLLEALALEVSEIVFAVNRMPGAIMEVLLRLFGLTVDTGAAATATATFVLSDPLGHEVPAGTRLRLNFGGAREPVEFVTVTGLAVPPGSTTGTVAIVATENGTGAHAGQINAPLELLDMVVFVNSVSLASVPGNGRDPEAPVDFLNRGVQRLSRLVTTLVLPEHFTAAALENEAVERATTVDNFNPDVGTGVPGDHPGHVTVAAAGANGVALPTATRDELEATLESQAMANLDVHVVAPTITNINVTATVVRRANYTDAQVLANVTTALDAYLSPDTWEWAATVYTNEIIALLDGVEGVERVVSVSMTGGTSTTGGRALAGVAPLADLGTVNLTVQAP